MSSGNDGTDGWDPLVIMVGAPFIAVMAGFLCHLACSRKKKDGRRRDPNPMVAAAREPQQSPEVVVAVEMRSGQLLCTYRRGEDGRQEAAVCSVCLSNLADGETVRVLPACMHYFHPACVGEWLRVNNTCPVCRAAPAPATEPPFPVSLAV